MLRNWAAGSTCPPALRESRRWEQRCGCYCCWGCQGCYAAPLPCPVRSVVRVLRLLGSGYPSESPFRKAHPGEGAATEAPQRPIISFFCPLRRVAYGCGPVDTWPPVPSFPGLFVLLRGGLLLPGLPMASGAMRCSSSSTVSFIKTHLLPVKSPSVIAHQCPCESAVLLPGCGLAPFDTSFPGLPLLSPGTPLTLSGAMRCSSSSIRSSFILSTSFLFASCELQTRPPGPGGCPRL